jgi:hypothetical protein
MIPEQEHPRRTMKTLTRSLLVVLVASTALSIAIVASSYDVFQVSAGPVLVVDLGMLAVVMLFARGVTLGRARLLPTNRAIAFLVLAYFVCPIVLALPLSAVFHDLQPVAVARALDRAPGVVSVVDYGAKGNGTADDTAAITRALQAARTGSRRVYFPPGIYAIDSIKVPKGLTLKGAGSDQTWLKGHLDFGSGETISDLKIGDAGDSAVHNRAGASGTTFLRCRFRGGGYPDGTHRSVVSLGRHDGCSDITFDSCEVECNLGSETSADFANGFNDIDVYAYGSAVVSGITFRGCHIGVSNGVRSGSPRMGIECYDDEAATRGFQNITLSSCTFEVTDAHCVDFSDNHNLRAQGIVIGHCTLMGGGARPTSRQWGYTLNLELPLGARVTDNVIYRGHDNAVWMANRGGYATSNCVFTGNTIELSYDNGLTMSGDGRPILLSCSGNVFQNNHVIGSGPTGAIVYLDGSATTGCAVNGNTFTSSGGKTPVVNAAGAAGNKITPNSRR